MSVEAPRPWRPVARLTAARRWLAVGTVAVLAALPLEAQVWTAQTTPTTNYLNNVHFVSETQGWVSGGLATLLRTTDGGDHWTAVTNTGVGSSQGFNSVRFLDSSTGWAGGLTAVTRTVSGGASWNTGTYSTQYYRNSHFPVSPTVCWAAGGGTDPGSGYPCRSHFRQTWTGTTWSVYQWNTCGAGTPGLNSIFMLDADTGWSVGNSGTIFHITGGSGTPTFTPQTSGTSQTLRRVQMLDASTGWVVGNSGTVLRTTNGGSSWQPGSSGVGDDLRGVYFLDSLTGWTVGSNGVILASTDGGQTWAPETSGVLAELAAVYCPSADTCYAVGQSGTILIRTGITEHADLEVEKTDGACFALPGESTDYTITVINHGPDDASGATVSDVFPASLTVSGGNCMVSEGASCGWSGNGDINDTVTIPAGGFVVYSAPATVSAAATGLLVNQATAAVAAWASDPVPGNNLAEDRDFLELPLSCDGFETGDTNGWSGTTP